MHHKFQASLILLFKKKKKAWHTCFWKIFKSSFWRRLVFKSKFRPLALLTIWANWVSCFHWLSGDNSQDSTRNIISNLRYFYGLVRWLSGWKPLWPSLTTRVQSQNPHRDGEKWLHRTVRWPHMCHGSCAFLHYMHTIHTKWISILKMNNFVLGILFHTCKQLWSRNRKIRSSRSPSATNQVLLRPDLYNRCPVFI